MVFGAQQGWWTDWDEIGPFKTIKMNVAEHPTLAHAVVAIGMFTSVTQARKNGWDKPMEAGKFTFKKRRVVLTVEA